jgi:hypothetical protein
LRALALLPRKIDKEAIAFCQISGQGIVRSDRASASLHIFDLDISGLPIFDLIAVELKSAIGN